MKLILASQSPRRAQILKDHGFEIKIQPADVDETQLQNESSTDYVQRVAHKKAKAILSDCHNQLVTILAADTIVVFQNKILGKPKDNEDAQNMLQQLSAQKHHVFTGFALYFAKTKKWLVDYDKTEVVFKELSEQQIADYVKSGDPFDKAGAYGIQSVQNQFVQNFTGSFYNVMGLPIEKILTYLSY